MGYLIENGNILNKLDIYKLSVRYSSDIPVMFSKMLKYDISRPIYIYISFLQTILNDYYVTILKL